MNIFANENIPKIQGYYVIKVTSFSEFNKNINCIKY